MNTLTFATLDDLELPVKVTFINADGNAELQSVSIYGTRIPIDSLPAYTLLACQDIADDSLEKHLRELNEIAHRRDDE